MLSRPSGTPGPPWLRYPGPGWPCRRGRTARQRRRAPHPVRPAGRAPVPRSSRPPRRTRRPPPPGCAAAELAAQIGAAEQEAAVHRERRPSSASSATRLARRPETLPGVRAEADRFRRAADDMAALVQARADRIRQEEAYVSAKRVYVDLSEEALRLRARAVRRDARRARRHAGRRHPMPGLRLARSPGAVRAPRRTGDPRAGRGRGRGSGDRGRSGRADRGETGRGRQSGRRPDLPPGRQRLLRARGSAHARGRSGPAGGPRERAGRRGGSAHRPKPPA